MNTPMNARITEALPRFQSSIAAVFYLVTILMGGVVLFVQGRLGLVVDLIATACYIAVTALFYRLSR
ncbi:MAG TPA: hypothetical protein VNX26_15120 [Candidatus Acidoferrum sp.]|jgi:hypothetical protein|nr:hypothetical protein [Candidatus Acidoferrum sp.]